MTEDDLKRAEELLDDPDAEDCERFASWFGSSLIAEVRQAAAALAKLQAERDEALERCGRYELDAIRDHGTICARTIERDEAREAWTWLADRKGLSIEYAWGDEGERGEWRVHREHGGVNDREWDLIGSGPTPLDAIETARAASRAMGDGE